MDHITHVVNAKPYLRAEAATGSRTMAVHNPATGAVIAELALAEPEDIDAAVGAAREAQPSWGRTSLTKRAAVVAEFWRLAVERRDDLARIVTEENGKLLDDARAEIDRGIEIAGFAASITDLLKVDGAAQMTSTVDVAAFRQPIGVVAGITPFNFPVMVGMWMHPLAIACGNAFVLKPSELVPSAANLVAEIWSDAGLPDGVFNVLHGDGTAAAGLVGHPEIAGVSFVGSTPTARRVYLACAEGGKRVQALGGAKNHVVVLPDADPDATADALIGAAYGSAGQRCMAASVIVAVGDTADHLVDAIAGRAARLVVGPGTAPEVHMGPLVSRAHLDRVRARVDTGVEQGATLVLDGRGVSVPGHEDGYFLGPCLFDHVDPSMAVYEEEVFGPVLSVVRAADLDEALSIVNANPYGNGASCFTSSGGAARRFAQEVTAGMVGINVAIPVPGAPFGFGGWKDSLFGDTHIYGSEGVRFYTRRKVVSTRWVSATPSPATASARPRAEGSGTPAGLTMPSGDRS